jgi:hypothetical protein
MFAKIPPMNPLELRRQLLTAESELCRAQLIEDMTTVAEGFRTLTDRAKSFGSIASSVAVLVVGLAALRRSKSEPTAAKHSWRQTILKSAGLFSTLWLAFRSQRCNQKDK